jgi:hypothetical protein
MNRTQWLIALGFLVALVAGAVLGIAQDRARTRPEKDSWLATELNLSAQQQEQLRTIWETCHKSGRDHRERRETLARERDEQVRALLTEEQKPLYEAILAEYRAKTDALSEERSRAFKEATEKTKALLDSSQRIRYEEILKEREKDREQRRPDKPEASR